MPATIHSTPDLQLPVTLASTPVAASAPSSSYQPLQTTFSSSTRSSQCSIGSAYKVSSDRSVRRLKGALPLLAKGQGITLINPANQTPNQSYTLSPSEQPCTPPLLVLRSRSAIASHLRTTYVGLLSGTASGQDSVRTEIWAYTEELSAKGKGIDEGTVRKESIAIPGHVRALHPVGSGEILAYHTDGAVTILSHEFSTDSVNGTPSGSTLKIVETVPSSDSKVKCDHHLSLIDPTSALNLLPLSTNFDKEELVALQVSIHSSISFEASAPKEKDAKKKKKGRKSAIDVIDEAEGKVEGEGGVISGPVHIGVAAILKVRGDGSNDIVGRSKGLRVEHLGTTTWDGVEESSDLVDCQVYPEGRIVALTRSGQLISTMISLRGSGPVLTPTRKISLAHLEHKDKASSPGAVLPLSQDHVLLVGVTNSAPTGPTSKERVVALLWDIELEALISQVEWALPIGSSIPSKSTQYPSVSVTRAAGSLAIIQLDPHPQCAKSGDAEAAKNLRSTVLALPFTCPEKSVLRHAMGKGNLTSSWIMAGREAAPAQDGRNEIPESLSTLDAGRRSLIRELRALSSKSARAEEMDAEFFKWVAEENAKARRGLDIEPNEDESVQAMEDSEDGKDRAKGENANGTQKPRQGKFSRGARPALELEYNFVTELLEATLPSSADKPYSHEILSFLLQKKAVSALMLNRIGEPSAASRAAPSLGLLARLRQVSDWENIMEATRNVPDLSEADLVGLLVDVLAHDQSDGPAEGSKEKASRTTPTWSRKPTLEAYLSRMITLPLSRPYLRVALKSSINDVEQVRRILETIKHWLDARAALPLEENLTIPSSKDAGRTAPSSKVDADGDVSMEPVPGKKQAKGAKLSINDDKIKVPKIDHILLFATDLLDTYFPLLLITPSTHGLLKTLSRTVSVHVSTMNTLQVLGAPLGAFAKLREEQEREAKMRKSGQATSVKNLMGQGALRMAETGGGLGLGLGTMAEVKSKRLHAFEESMLVGAYAFERLEI
ncbi:hypothetical protein IE53DRAFT_383982 [Violaceomyces palustris]|uniref:Uncharacterized protein n=1 Tax=Violaceomyces palustris TaxID=1673888 RepID=A0ACD0P635_9BASI|nr:hypothetical protein IE53DRAFT_383982 [Violaceomyces palustris]